MNLLRLPIPLRLLLAALLFTLSLGRTALAAEPAAAAKPLTPAEAEKWIASKKDLVLLDVRSARDHADGHIRGAVNIDSRSPELRTELAKLDRSKTYLVHCTRGLKRTDETVDALHSLGFKNVAKLEGGLNAWVKEGKPLSK